ncbi:MAG: nitrite reductase small subunit NirD [Acidimicrobiales bacterium]
MTIMLSATGTDVCAASSLIPGRGVAALVDGEQVALFVLPCGAVRAIDNRDPFTGVHVLSRGLVGSIGDAVVVASPIYKQHFDLSTGVCIEDPDVSVRTWAASVVDDRVVVGRPMP